MRATYWQKIAEAKEIGVTPEQFERLESLEAAIAYHQNEIDDCEEKIKCIKEEAKLSKVSRS